MDETRPDDRVFMQRALQLAARAMYTTDPNPRVGCVIVRDGRVVGEGSTMPAGGAHAEIRALEAAGEQAAGATVYVTLEPCSHHGRTPPCAIALIQARVRRVVVAMVDPNPRVNGTGLDALARAGIAIEGGVLEAEARVLNLGFVHRMATGRPWVRLKLAASLDGRTAMASGESRWITGAEARRDVQHWRARSSAILTGIGTVLADNPRLDVRSEELPPTDGAGAPSRMRQPLRVVVDSHARLPAGCRLLAGGGPVLLATLSSSGRVCAGPEVLRLPAGADRRVCLDALLDVLGVRECNELHVECGATLAGRLLEQRLVDELLVYLAPCVLGSAARPLFALPDLGAMPHRVRLAFTEVSQLGDDVRLLARPLGREPVG